MHNERLAGNCELDDWVIGGNGQVLGKAKTNMRQVVLYTH